MSIVPPHSFRFKALLKLADIIHGITPENGFYFDLSSEDSVTMGRLFVGNDEPLPMVAINEPPLAIEQIRSAPQNPARAGDWDLLIQGWAKEGQIHPTEYAYTLAAEVQQVLAAEKTKPSGRPGSGKGYDFLGFGPKISDMRIGAPVVRPPDETSANACFYIILTLQISEDMTKPFG